MTELLQLLLFDLQLGFTHFLLGWTSQQLFNAFITLQAGPYTVFKVHRDAGTNARACPLVWAVPFDVIIITQFAAHVNRFFSEFFYLTISLQFNFLMK